MVIAYKRVRGKIWYAYYVLTKSIAFQTLQIYGMLTPKCAGLMTLAESDNFRNFKTGQYFNYRRNRLALIIHDLHWMNFESILGIKSTLQYILNGKYWF